MTKPLGITRTRVLLRARYGWPRRSVPFSNTEFHHPDGYRTNAPGFVSMCYDIPISARAWGGANIITLLTDGWLTEIDKSDLKPGDALGYIGPDAVDSDGGAIMIFDKWLNHDIMNRMALTWDHLPVVGMGPDQRAHSIDYKWHAYRFKYILEDAPRPTLVSV